MIRELTIKDYDKVLELWMKIDGVGLRSLDDSKEGINKFINRNPKSCFVYEIDNEIVGIILSGNDGRRGYIYHTAVLKDFRGKGIGKALVDKVIKVMKELGINKVALVVFEDNKVGNDFWEKYGFKSRNDLIYRDMSINQDNL